MNDPIPLGGSAPTTQPTAPGSPPTNPVPKVPDLNAIPETASEGQPETKDTEWIRTKAKQEKALRTKQKEAEARIAAAEKAADARAQAAEERAEKLASQAKGIRGNKAALEAFFQEHGLTFEDLAQTYLDIPTDPAAATQRQLDELRAELTRKDQEAESRLASQRTAQLEQGDMAAVSQHVASKPEDFEGIASVGPKALKEVMQRAYRYLADNRDRHADLDDQDRVALIDHFSREVESEIADAALSSVQRYAKLGKVRARLKDLLPDLGITTNEINPAQKVGPNDIPATTDAIATTLKQLKDNSGRSKFLTNQDTISPAATPQRASFSNGNSAVKEERLEAIIQKVRRGEA